MKKTFLLLFALICLSIANAQTTSDSIYITPDIPATFVGGDSARIAFIKMNLKTEKLKIDSNTTKIYIQFVIEKSGAVSNAKLLKRINKQADVEVLRMIKSMPKWTAAQNNKRIVRSQVVMPIKLKSIIVEAGVDTTYYNKEWKKTTIENADYFRIRKSNSLGYEIISYSKNEGIMKHGEYSSLSPEIRNGHFITYYINGVKKSEYNCINDTLQGESINYYPSGKVKSKTYFLNSKKDGDSFEYLENDSLLVKKVFKDDNCINCDSLEGNEVYTKVDVMPEFPGGENARLKFFGENLKYPVDALYYSIEGTVYTQFIVEKDGALSNIKVLRGIGGGCEEECVRILELMPNWIPGKQNGKLVRTKFVMPTRFNLN